MGLRVRVGVRVRVACSSVGIRFTQATRSSACGKG